jgi:hypothetical protein
MKTSLAMLLGLAVLLAAPAARADGDSLVVIDTGRFFVLDHGARVGVEEFEYDRQGDSVMVSATHTRTARGADGAAQEWVKKFGLVVGRQDFGLRSYVSNLAYGGHVSVRGVVPGDTAMTVYSEIDGNGDAVRIAQPPGRLFVMDPMLFTLFDVVCRNVSASGLARRPVELVTLGDPPGANEAVATVAGDDTIRWGGRRMITKRWTLKDDNSVFDVWVSPAGQMLRLVHEESGLEVLREEPKPAPRATKRKPAAR